MGLFDWLGPLAAARRAPYELGDIGAPSQRKLYYYDGPSAALTTRTLVAGAGFQNASEAAAQNNAAVYACLQALSTAYPEPPLRVYRQADGKPAPDPSSPLQRLLDRPNAHLSAEQLLSWTVTALHVDGNAYWRKVRSASGAVAELWPISPARIEIRSGEEGAFIGAYRYHYAAGRYLDLAPADVIHFRLGLDDNDHRRGASPLLRLLRQVSSDNNATQFADALLRNYAVPGLVVQVPPDSKLTPEDAAELKARITSAYGAENRGNVGVLTGGATLSPVGFSPEQLDLKALHRIPEERIAAVLGVPAIVAGLGAGLDRATYANMAEAREMFTEAKLVPLWRSTAATLDLQLVPEYAEEGLSVAFDLGEVRALADDATARYQRLTLAVQNGWMLADEARASVGLPPLEPAPQAPPEGEARARLLLLERKAPGSDEYPPEPGIRGRVNAGLPEEILALGAKQLPLWDRRIRAYLRAKAAELAAHIKETGGVLQWDARVETEELASRLKPLRLDVLEQMRLLVEARLGTSIELDDPITRDYLLSSGALITQITDTTRADVQRALAAGQAQFENLDQLAARLQALGTFGAKRARLIARTELGYSANAAALANYRASGLVAGVVVYDGDYDPACQEMNGRRYSLDRAPALLQHPNCRRAFAPIVMSEERAANG